MKLIKEFATFSSVCKSWRKITLDHKYFAPQPAWLMLLPNNPDDKHHWQIYSLPKEYTLTQNFHIPESYDKRCIGLNYGWILTISRLGGAMSLVHPVSRRRIELPPHTSIEGIVGIETNPSYTFFSRVTLCGNPLESSDFTVVASHAKGMTTHSWTSGYDYWISAEVYKILGGIQDLSCYRDQIYAVTFKHNIVVLKPDYEGFFLPHLIGKIDSLELSNELYIVGSARGLLIISRYRKEIRNEVFRKVEQLGGGVGGEHVFHAGGEHVEEYEEEYEEEEMEIEVPEEVLEEEMDGDDWVTEKFHVFEFDLISGECKKATNLGDRAIFVGHNTSMCFDHASKLNGIKSNHIYFTDDNFKHYVRHFEGGGKDMGIYNLEDGRITQFKIDESSYQSRSRICPPFWFLPSF